MLLPGKDIRHWYRWDSRSHAFDINSLDEFYNYVDTIPELKKDIWPAKFTYATAMASISVQHFQRLYQNYNHEFSIRYSSRSSVTEITEKHAIYVGTFHNNNKFINFFNNANPYFKIVGKELTFTNHPELKDTTYNIYTPEKLQEIAVVAKYPGTENTEHFVFFSQHDIGVTATVEYFTNPDSIKSFTHKYLDGKEYFTAVFTVKGQDRTNTDMSLEMVVNF